MTRNRIVPTAFALAIACSTAGTAAGQSWSSADARRMSNFHAYGVPDPGYVPNAYYLDSTGGLPPNMYARRATPGGLIETAARRVNPFSATSRAWDVAFAPAPYRQPPPSYRVLRPRYGTTGYLYEEPHTVPAPTGTIVSTPTGAHVPGVTCPTCPR